MRLSHKYKFLYIAPPKTGSETIRVLLNKYSELSGGPPINKNEFTSKPPYTHSKAKDLQLYFEANHWNYDEYYKFSFARNPWARQVSTYEYQYLNGKRKKDMTFKQHLLSKLPHSPCLEWIEKNGNIIVDFIGKLENLQEDFNTICDKIGIPQQQLPHKNATKHKHYTEYYDDETRQIVAEKYAKDIEYFNYKFGE